MTLRQSNTKQWLELFTKVDQLFDVEELRTLCFRLEDELGIDFDSLHGEGKRGKARELVRYCKRNVKAESLLTAAQEFRPDVDWPKFSEPTPADTGHKVKVHLWLEGKFEDLPQERLEILPELIASVLRITPDDISMVDVKAGSVVVTLEMFAEDAVRLMTLFRCDNKSLARLRGRKSITSRISALLPQAVKKLALSQSLR